MPRTVVMLTGKTDTKSRVPAVPAIGTAHGLVAEFRSRSVAFLTDQAQIGFVAHAVKH